MVESGRLPPGGTLRPGGREAARAAAAAALVLAVFFSPAIAGPGQFVFRDAGRMHHPVKSWIATRLAAGHLPEWNPYCGLGAPVVATSVDAVQHPFNVLLLALPFEAAFKAWVLLSYLLASAGGYLWSRRLGLGWHASVAAGLAYALSGHLVSASDNLTFLSTFAAIPLVFAAAHGAGERFSPSRLALCAGASGLCAAGGDPQGWAIAAAGAPLCVLLAAGDGLAWRARLPRAGAVLGACLLGAAPVVLPVLSFMPQSSRGGPLSLEELHRWNLAPVRMLELVVPHLFRPPESGGVLSPAFAAFAGGNDTALPWAISIYCGISVAILAAAGAAVSRRARVLLAAAAVFTWMAMGHHGGFLQLARGLPLVRSFRYFDKLLVWPSLLLPMAAGFGLEAVVSGRSARRVAAIGFPIAAAALALWGGLALFPGAAADILTRRGDVAAARQLVLQAGEGLVHAGLFSAMLGALAMAAAAGRMGARGPALLALLVVGDVAAANVRAYVLGPSWVAGGEAPLAQPIRARTPLERVVTPYPLEPGHWPGLRPFEAAFRWGDHTLMPSWNVVYRIGNFDEYTGMLPVRTARFIARVERPKLAATAGLWGFGWAVIPDSPGVAAQAGLRRRPEVAAVDPELPAFLVRAPHRDRAYLARRLSSVDRRGAMEFALRVDPESDLSAVEGPLPSGYLPPDGEVRFERDEPEEVVLRAISDRPALLVLSDALAPGWTATVDGRMAEILPANYLVRGVWIGPGEHRVAFSYRTPLLREGWAILAAGLLGLAAWSIARRARRARAPSR